MMQRLVNGSPADTLALADRAVQFGDGVFRTLKMVGGAVPFWLRQLDRLTHDAALLGIEAPAASDWLADIAELHRQGVRDAALKFIVTRGESQRGYAVPDVVKPTRIAQAAPLPAYPDTLQSDGVAVRWCDTKASWQPRLAGIKHLNRLENVLARNEWRDAAIFEGLMCDRDGAVIEGVMSNVLLQEGKALVTPKLESGGVAGVMRSVALEAAARLNWSVSEININPERLLRANRVWLCNSLIGMVPVRELAGRHWESHPADQQLLEVIRTMEKEETACF
ncbi:4-amino-4-deoxychorismate lyase [Andreprevotia lacus DSM 23236]|jgi:4-amino-4-deoxychorismate lyase|uniref:aminodeoxychorismate lyase n=1 Tax=Andreprevotia lacus DSM 23236 TaxID=1121001 RepID=A0A1W1Y0A8_9NEIS|nr:aminodeoxychorismate lyase [Andreprevotia lacus]SMC29221.1 4-amino-4-deoxychorismate lyase [Andreprevotia lacus DSM 23236]